MIEYHKPGQHSNCSPERCGHPRMRSIPTKAAAITPSLDALSALLAAATEGEWFDDTGKIGAGDSGIGEMDRSEDAALIVAAVTALPSLIEAARREAAIRHWWETTHATELDRHDHHCPAERFRGPPPGHFENTGEPCTCGWTEASAALHDNAGTPVATPGTSE